MRRLTLLLALLTAGPAAGQSGFVADLGAPPYSVTNGADLYPALEAARRDLAADVAAAGSMALEPMIVIPPGDFLLSRPFVTGLKSLRIKGAGSGQTRIRPAPGGISAGIVVSPRHTMAADRFVRFGDIPGMPDVPLHGLRMDGTHLTFNGTPFTTRARQWRDARAVCVEVVVSGLGPGEVLKTFSAGMYSDDAGAYSGPLPWAFYSHPSWDGVTHFQFRTTDGVPPRSGDYRDWTTRAVAFTPRADSRGVVRFAAQVDLAAADVRVYVNGVRVDTGLGGIGAGWDRSRDLHFAPCEFAPFNVGAPRFLVDYTGPGFDGVLCGLSAHEAVRYSDGGPGTAAVPAPEDRRSLAGALTFSGSPGDANNALVPAVAGTPHGGNHTFYGLWRLNQDTGNGGRPPILGRNVIEGLTYLDHPGPPFSGAAVQVGANFGLTVRDCALSGGAFGLQFLPAETAYFERLDGVSLSGGVACLHVGNGATVQARDLELAHPQLYGALLAGGALVADRVFVSDSETALCSFRACATGTGGVWLGLRDVYDDSEGSGAPTEAFVLADPGNTAAGTVVEIRDYNLAIPTNPGIDWVYLRDFTAPGAAPDQRARFRLDGLTAFGRAGRSVVAVEGDCWEGWVGNFSTGLNVGVDNLPPAVRDARGDRAGGAPGGRRAAPAGPPRVVHRRAG